MRLAIVGSRTFNDYEYLKSAIRKLVNVYEIQCIVSGGAKGADSLAERFAKENNIKTMIFPADWVKYGKKAGYIRNKDIILNSDTVIAFWDGISKGTKISIDLAKISNKTIFIEIFQELI